MHGLQACLLKYITVAALHIYLSVVKMPLKGDVRGHVLNSHGTYIVDHGQSWKNFEFLWEPCIRGAGKPPFASVSRYTFGCTSTQAFPMCP